MDPLHHRVPNLLSFALGFEGVFVELIADGVHVVPEVMKVVLACKADRVVVVSDMIRVAGVEEGVYEMGGEAVEVRDGVARLVSSGSLAGRVPSSNS
jgi:N-acetylglucosamine-6-phosphate deacetylase